MGIMNKLIDYRMDFSKSRNFPIIIPDSLKTKIIKLMGKLNLQTGSLDFLKSIDDNQFYFLEVNPNGQFDFVSQKCNYYLEKKIAQYL